MRNLSASRIIPVCFWRTASSDGAENTLVFAVITGPVGYLLSLLVAWLINDLSPKFRWFLTLIFYAPAISGSAVAVWSFIFSADRHGYANSILLQLGIINESIAWFKDPRYMLGTIIVVQLWMSLGTSFLAFIAGLQGWIARCTRPARWKVSAISGRSCGTSRYRR